MSLHNEWMRWRRVAVVAGIMFAIGAAGVAGSGLVIYNEATKIDRSNPKVVTDEYLRAALVRKDKIGADLYACSDQSKLAPIDALLTEIAQREKDFGVEVLVDWVEYVQAGSERQVTLTTELTISGRKGGAVTSKRTETWSFDLVVDDGWRVCGAKEIAPAGPSPTPATTP